MTRTWKTSAIAVMAMGALASACADQPNTQRDAVGGGALGALAGAVIGNNFGGGNAAQGAAIGAVLGATAGAVRGSEKDRKVNDTRQYYDERAQRYYYYDPSSQRYFWENGEPRS